MTTVTKSHLIQIHYTILKSIIMQVIIFLALGCAKSYNTYGNLRQQSV